MKSPMHILPISPRQLALLALMGAAGLAACNQDLIAPVPDFVLPDQIAGTAALGSAYAATLSDFQVGYAGSGTVEGIVNMSGTLSDELFNAETFPTRIEVDKRTTNPVNATMLPIFRNIQRARHTAELVEARFGLGDPTNVQRAEVQALAAYTYVLLAENYCNGVPTSNVDASGAFLYGPAQTTTQLWTLALQKFDSAITLSTAAGANGTTTLNLARIGKGRVLLDQAQFAAAAAAVASVPTNFAYNVQHDANTTRQNNGVFAFMFSVKRFTVADKEGTNGLPFVSSGDIRVAAKANGLGADAITPEFQTLKYQDRSSPTPLALGTEARLIQAEAFLQAGDTARFFAYVDSARIATKTFATGPVGTSAGVLAPISAAKRDTLGRLLPVSARIDYLFSERAFDLFLTAHRVGDMRRLIRAPYSRNPETVFPTGVYPKSLSPGNYGPDVNLPIPYEEVNNPEFTGCIDRSA
jgi:hypothetical protein